MSQQATMPHGSYRVVVLACTRSGVSRTARPLRARGCVVQTCGDLPDVVARIRRRDFDILVLERDHSDRAALDLLFHLKSEGLAPPCVLVTPYTPDILATAINEARVTRVVRADQDLDLVLEEILAVVQVANREPAEILSLKSRCQMLEENNDRLVRESIQREGAARLLHDLLVEIGHASGLKEVAGRCMARVVTALRLDMAFIVLPSRRNNRPVEFSSFACPRDIRRQLQELPWTEVLGAVGALEGAIPLSGLLEDISAACLVRSLRIAGFVELVAFPLRPQDRTLGFLGLGCRAQQLDDERRWEQLVPVAKQIGIALENSRLVDAARDAKGLAKGVLQHLPTTVLLCDSHANVLECFDTRQNIFQGRTVVGKRLSDLLSPGDADALLRPLTAVAHGADPVFLRGLRLSLSGAEKLLHASIAPLPDGNTILILDDVTRRESLASDLRRARALTCDLFANAPAGVLFLRQSGEIVDINDTACAILREKRNDLLGKNLKVQFADLWRAVEMEALGGRTEIAFRVREDQQAIVSMSATRVGRSGRPAGILVQIQDLGEIEALREELRRRDHLALMGQMVSFIAHEIKNPLFGISSAAQVLAREKVTPEAEQLSQAMLSEIERLGQLLEELLVFGSKRQIQPVRGDLTEVCREIATMNQELLESRQVRLELDVEDSENSVYFDPARMRQVIVNLVNNGIDAASPGGQIRISGRALKDEYVVAVKNSGAAIPIEDRDRIFDLFYSTKQNGNGLGLPICRKIVEDHGGRIEVQSSQEEGTSFAVYLPLA